MKVSTLEPLNNYFQALWAHCFSRPKGSLALVSFLNPPLMKTSFTLGQASLVLMLALLFTGCARDNPMGPESDPSETPKEESAAENEAKITEKMNYYADCVNIFSGSVSNTKNQYLTHVDLETGPTGSENYALVPKLYQDPANCLEGIRTANAIEIEAQLNEPATAYARALETLSPLIIEANAYYEQENYKDDAFAKGKEMHPPLMAAFGQFEQAETTLRQEMDIVQKTLSERSLTQMKESGDELGYLHTKLMVDAEEMVKLTDVENLDGLNLESFTAAVTNYEASFGALASYEQGNKDEVSGIGAYSFFTKAKDDVLTSGKKVMRAKRDGAITDLQAQYDLLEEFVDDYNALVNSFNGLIY